MWGWWLAARARLGFTPYWVQGGRTVAAINQRLLEEGFCLQTSGVDDEHRLAGAIATGTHSSAIDVGAMHDAVLAVHLVVGPEAVVVQSSSRPAVSPAFAEWLERQTELPTELVTDDEQFRAVLVSLGSLGVVFSAIVEAVPAYRLQPRAIPSDLMGLIRRVLAVRRVLGVREPARCPSGTDDSTSCRAVSPRARPAGRRRVARRAAGRPWSVDLGWPTRSTACRPGS